MTQQWCTDYGRRVQVLITRRLDAAKSTLGVGEDGMDGYSAWYVYHRADETGVWHKHCGPYVDMAQAVDWINGIREGPVEQAGVTGRDQ